MIKNSQYDLILRLKQQARHGMADTPNNDNPYNNPLNIDWNTVTDSGKAFLDLIKTLTTAVDNFGSAFDKLNKGFATSLGIQTIAKRVSSLGDAYTEATKDALALENRNKQLNKGFGITTAAAAKLSENLQKVASTYKFTSQQSMQYAVGIKKMLPTFNQTANTNTEFYASLQKVQDITRTNLGLSEEQANSYTQYAASQNESADASLRVAQAVAKAFGDESGDLGYFSMITTEIAGLSEDIQLQYGKVPGNLETAVIKAKKFGLSIEQIAKASSDMLQIETSIGQELEYQLLSGRRLVDSSGKSLTNTFREAALRGDMNAQADAMNKILEQEGETLENNLFARKQMAELLGMDEKSLSSALQKKKILDKAAASGITIDLNGSNALEQAAAAVEAGALSPADFESLKNATDTRSTEDLLKQILDVEQETLFATVLGNQQQIISATKSGITGGAKELLKNLGISDEMINAVGTAQTIKNVLKAGSDAKTGIKGGTGKGLPGSDQVNQLDGSDVVIPPGSSKAILMGPDQINLRDDDMVIAGTNLGGTGGNNTNMQTFANMIVAAINNQTAQLKQNDRLFGGGMNAPYYG
jgi:hypothetical protein